MLALACPAVLEERDMFDVGTIEVVLVLPDSWHRVRSATTA